MNWLKCVDCGWEKEVDKDYIIDHVCPKCHSQKLVIEQEKQEKERHSTEAKEKQVYIE